MLFLSKHEALHKQENSSYLISLNNSNQYNIKWNDTEYFNKITQNSMITIQNTNLQYQHSNFNHSLYWPSQ